MYPTGGNPNYQYQNQAYGVPSKSPPPLQHPVPQHPIPDFGPAVQQSASSQQTYQYNQNPMMQQQQQQQQQTYNPNAYNPQPMHQNNDLYSQFGFNDPAAQMGMQFAGTAMAQGSAYMEKNVRIERERKERYQNPFAQILSVQQMG